MIKVPLNQKEINALLEKEGLTLTLDQPSGQYYATLMIKKWEITLFCMPLSDESLFQVLAYMPFQMHPKAVEDVARLLHHLNKDLDLPGLAMDEKEKLVFYRLVFPCIDKELDVRLVGLAITAVKVVSENFMHSMMLVSKKVGH